MLDLKFKNDIIYILAIHTLYLGPFLSGSAKQTLLETEMTQLNDISKLLKWNAAF